MHFLLDEDVDVGLAGVLRALGHDADHVAADLGRAGISDEEVAVLAADYDFLLTIDLHRQEPEWIAVNEAMLGSVRVIRMRFTKSESTELIDQARMLLFRWREWMRRFDVDGARLVTLSGIGGTVRHLDAAGIAAILAQR